MSSVGAKATECTKKSICPILLSTSLKKVAISSSLRRRREKLKLAQRLGNLGDPLTIAVRSPVSGK